MAVDNPINYERDFRGRAAVELELEQVADLVPCVQLSVEDWQEIAGGVKDGRDICSRRNALETPVETAGDRSYQIGLSDECEVDVSFPHDVTIQGPGLVQQALQALPCGIPNP